MDNELAIYIDVIDEEGNYFTVRQPLASNPNVLMNAFTYQTKLNEIHSSVSNTFNEVKFEQNIYNLRQVYHALYSDYVNKHSLAIESIDKLA